MLSFSFPSIVCLCLLILTNVSYLIWAWIDCSFSWMMFANVMTYYLSTFVLHRLVRELYSWIFFLNTPKVNILMHNCCNLSCRQFIFTQIHNLYLLCFAKLLLSFISSDVVNFLWEQHFLQWWRERMKKCQHLSFLAGHEFTIFFSQSLWRV